jgi:DNA/RNA-binding domain of Phe-tRNA-synthetase-like protein
MTIPIAVAVSDPDLLLGIVEASGVSCGPASPSLAAQIEAALARRAARTARSEPGTNPSPSAEGEPAAPAEPGTNPSPGGGGFVPGSAPAGVRAAIRDLLRKGGYKPTGRGKPASEYLAQAAERGEWPRVNHAVDALNLVSLESGLPISLLDADRALEDASALVVRLGAAGEKYVFNAAGHEIDVEGLLCVAKADGPCIGNAVKDSMATKTTPDTRNVVAIVWASRRAIDEPGLRAVCDRLARLLDAEDTSVRVLATTPA